MRPGQSSASSGLSTDTYVVKTAAGIYSISTRTTMKPISGLVVTIAQSGSTSASFASAAASGGQKHLEMNAKFNCQIGDTLTVVVSSSTLGDLPPNLIKTIINLKQGI